MADRPFNSHFLQMRAAIREYWPTLSDEDVDSLVAGREDVLRMLAERHPRKPVTELAHELADFELRGVRAARVSIGRPLSSYD